MQPDALLRLWARLGGSAAGRWLFARLLARAVPYTGSIGARVEALAPGTATVVLRDRRAVRNHLRSIHAVALANLGEVASGLAMLSALPPGCRGIVTHLGTDYHAKARGRLVATGRASPPPIGDDPVEAEAVAEIHDPAGVLVATVTATWRLERRDDG